MKCECCHKNDAQTAIKVERDGQEEELYVCRACAGKARVARQKKSQRTRKSESGDEESSVSFSVGGVIGPDDKPPPIIAAFLDAVHGVMHDIEGEIREKNAAGKRKEGAFRDVPCGRMDFKYRIGKRLHLEGLHLLGELEAVQRAVRAVHLKIVGVEADGVRDTGHVYTLSYFGARQACAKRVADDIVAQERNARVRLFEEMPRVFGDSLCRALAILKNCRLLSSGELFDLLSPLRLAAIEGMLDGIGLDEIDKMLNEADLSSSEDMMSQEERDAADAARADEINRRFEDVVLNERAEGEFL